MADMHAPGVGGGGAVARDSKSVYSDGRDGSFYSDGDEDSEHGDGGDGDDGDDGGGDDGDGGDESDEEGDYGGDDDDEDGEEGEDGDDDGAGTDDDAVTDGGGRENGLDGADRQRFGGGLAQGDAASQSSHGETAKSMMQHWQPMLDDDLKQQQSPVRLIQQATAGVDLRAVAIGTVLCLLLVIVIRPPFVLKEALTRFDTPGLDPVKLLLFAALVAAALTYLTRR